MIRVNKVLRYLAEQASGASRAKDRADILNDLAGITTRQRLAYEEAISWVQKYYKNIKTDDMLRIYWEVTA